MRIIDVSHNNGRLNWAAIGECAEIEGIQIKASEGTGFTDPQFEINKAGAAGVGKPYGSYHFLRPDSDAGDQAAHYCSVIGNEVGALVPWIDVEVIPSSSSPHGDLWYSIPIETRILKIIHFADVVLAQTGVDPALYASPSFVEEQLGSDPRLARFRLVVAEYGVSAPRIPAPFTEYYGWQNSESAHLAGMSGVDTDVMA